MKLRTALTATLLLAVLPRGAAAQETVFSRRYVRQTGPPVTVSDTFTVCDVAGQFTLAVENGPGGSGRISSGTIAVNGLEVVPGGGGRPVRAHPQGRAHAGGETAAGPLSLPTPPP